MNRRFTCMFTPEQHTGGHLLLPDGDAGQAGDGGQGGAGGGTGTGGAGTTGQGGKEGPPKGGETDWQSHARTWEQRANADRARAEAAEKRIADLERSQMTAAEKAIADAREEGRLAGLNEGVNALVEARLDAALANRIPDDEARKALLDPLDRTRFLKDGKPDTAAITAWAERIAPKGSGGAGGAGGMPDLGQGRRSEAPTTDMDALIRRAAGVRTG